jgi:hypothetical protein
VSEENAVVPMVPRSVLVMIGAGASEPGWAHIIGDRLGVSGTGICEECNNKALGSPEEPRGTSDFGQADRMLYPNRTGLHWGVVPDSTWYKLIQP